MTDATISTAAAPFDIAEFIKTEVAKEVAAAKAEESALVTKVKTFITTHYSKVVTAAIGWVTAHFGLLEAAWKLI